MPDGYRIEKDSLGEVRVPADALYGAQTQRAIENFPISGQRFGTGLYPSPRPAKEGRGAHETRSSAISTERSPRPSPRRRERLRRVSGMRSSSSTSTRPGRAPRRT